MGDSRQQDVPPVDFVRLRSLSPSPSITVLFTALALTLLSGYYWLNWGFGPARAFRFEITRVPKKWNYYQRVPTLEERRVQLLGLRGEIPQVIAKELGPYDILLVPPRTTMIELVGSDLSNVADPRWIASLARIVDTRVYGEEGWEDATHALLTVEVDGRVQAYLPSLDDVSKRNAVISVWEEAAAR